MPELPEVETLRLGLNKYVVGHKILDVEILNPKIFVGEPKDIIGSTINSVRRIGKGLILDLSNGYSLAIHIKLTGQLVYQSTKTKKFKLSQKVGESLPNKFTHIVFKLDKNAKLYYNDMRRFGWIKIVKSSDALKMPFFRDMGPEPPVAKALEGRPSLTLEKLRAIVKSSPVKIKPLIMGQKRIGGIGNIYANDALFLARIDPKTQGRVLSEKEVRELYGSILTVLKKGLESKGASELSFVNILGQEGGYQNHTLIYGKRGKKCPRCGTKIEFEKIAGRGTYYCPNCQI